MPANCPDFVGTVPIFDFQNLQKSGRPDFLEFQPVNILVLRWLEIVHWRARPVPLNTATDHGRCTQIETVQTTIMSD